MRVFVCRGPSQWNSFCRKLKTAHKGLAFVRIYNHGGLQKQFDLRLIKSNFVIAQKQCKQLKAELTPAYFFLTFFVGAKRSHEYPLLLLLLVNSAQFRGNEKRKMAEGKMAEGKMTKRCSRVQYRWNNHYTIGLIGCFRLLSSPPPSPTHKTSFNNLDLSLSLSALSQKAS